MNDLVLETNDVRLVILPDHGCDLHSMVHRSSDVDVLFKPHWSPSGRRALGGDRAEWIADYRGGWQVLVPNAGDACVRDGQTWGFHGEASTVPWTVERADPTGAVTSVELRTAPLRVERTISVDGPRVGLHEVVHNTSSSEAEVMYVHHPAFGAPLISPGTRVATGARSVLSDPQMPGSFVAPNATGAWPNLPTRDGEADLSVIPEHGDPRALMAYLTDFDDPFYTITNDDLGLAVTVRWTAEHLPHAWLWQEFRHTPHAPWARQGYAMAIEPASTIPGLGLNYVNEHGGRGLIIPAHDSVTTTIELTVSSTT